MWLPKDKHNSNHLEVEDSKLYLETHPNMSLIANNNSPPLEGGEALCEFYVCSEKEKTSVLCIAGGEPHLGEDSNRRITDDTCQQKLKTSSSLTEESAVNRNLFLLFDHQELPSDTFTKTFLQSILTSVDSQDPVVANAWMETLLDIIDLLPGKIIKEEILSLAISKGQIFQSVSSHLLSCRMLGKLSTKFDPFLIKKEILPIVLSLCQDADIEVRKCICQQLASVASGLGLDSIKNAILPELVELSNDCESSVRMAVIETVVEMLPLLDNETSAQIIVPLVQKLCDDSLSAEESNLPFVSLKLGKLCLGLSNNLINHHQKSWFLDYFRTLSKLGLPHCRKNIAESSETTFFSSPMPDLVPALENKDRQGQCRWACAFNFPAIVLFAGSENFQQELKETYSELCCDPLLDVRKTIASGFSEVAKLLSGEASVLLPDLISILNDDSLEVLKGMIPNLADILKLICRRQTEPLPIEQVTKDLVKALIISLETTSFSSNWRHHAGLLAQMSCLPQCLPSETIYTTFVPMLFVKLHTCRPLPCRIAAAHSLLLLLRNTHRLEDRNGIINELIRELCKGRSCYKRMLFIKVCHLVTELFSKAFFKRHFFVPVLSLSEDPVPNIRLQLCAIFPKLKSLLKLPKDGTLLEKLESCVKNLMSSEKDRDVCAAITKAIGELDKIEVPCESISRPSSMRVKMDLEDKRKEEEENCLLELELKAKFSKMGPFHLVTKSLTRQGKIPVRKNTSTLPKIAKQKSQRNPTIDTKSDQEKSCSSLSQKVYKCVANIKQGQKNPSFRQCTTRNVTPPATINRCPSPRPQLKFSDEPSSPRQSRLVARSEIRLRNAEAKSNNPSVEKQTPFEKRQYSHSPMSSRIPTPKPR